MQSAKGSGIVPMDADVVMIGVRPERYDNFQRAVKGSLQSMHMGWSYVANLSKSFEHLIGEFLPNRRGLDLVYIADETNQSRDELRKAATKLSFELAKHPAKPWVVLDSALAWLEHIFDTRQVKVYYSIEGALQERHEKRCEAAHAPA